MCYGKIDAKQVTAQTQKERDFSLDNYLDWLNDSSLYEIPAAELAEVTPEDSMTNTDSTVPSIPELSQSNATLILPKPLPTINLSSLDIDALQKQQIKRQKNTEAARASRKRKVDLLKSLQDKVEDLSNLNGKLETQNLVLEKENEGFKKRIEGLEKQVEELHCVLVAFGKDGSGLGEAKRRREE